MTHKNPVWNSYLNTQRTDQERVELTSGITNRLLRYGIDEKQGYELEVRILDKLFEGLPINEEIRRGFEALKIFIPRVPAEILNRYDTVKYEISSLHLDNLIIGACGLSPLGKVIAIKKPTINIWDTDLIDIVSYRNAQNKDKLKNYHIKEWDLLSELQPSFLNEIHRGKTAIVVEGLTFYLDNHQMKQFHRNIQKFAIKVGAEQPAKIIMDYYIADIPARQRDIVVNPQHPEWESFKKLISNVHDSQRSFWKSRKEVKKYLRSLGYKNIRVSPISTVDNAHTVFVFEY